MDLYYWEISPRELRRMREAAPYTHVIRAPDDPDRRPRGSGGEHALGVAPHQSIQKMSRHELTWLLWEALGEAETNGLTFHALSVHIFDLGADVTCMGPLDEALFAMVARGWVAMTMEAPVRFLRTVDLDLKGFDPPPPFDLSPRDSAPEQLSLLS